MAKNKNTKMKKTRGSITNIEFIDGHIKVELQDEDFIVGTANIDLANLPYPVVDNVMGELLSYVEEIPEVVDVAEKYFDEYTEPYGASAKKSKMKKSDSQYRVYDESGEEYVGDKGTILNVVGNMLDGLDLPLVGRGSVTLTFEFMDDSGYEASTKKSATKIDMSFEDNVNKMRQANYAKTGNINTVMKKRD